MLLDRDLAVQALSERLIPLVEESTRRNAMASAARTLGRPNAAAELADTVAALASRHAG